MAEDFPRTAQDDPTALELDLSTDEMTKKFASARIFAKKGKVQARTAVAGESLQTVLADGTVETSNTAEEGDVIVTNPGGEQYILKPDNFAKRYETTEDDGVYRAKGMARAFTNPTAADIQITAPWGELQYGGAECMIATVYDPSNPVEISADRYIIGAEEFAATYGPAEEVYGPDFAGRQQPEQPN